MNLTLTRKSTSCRIAIGLILALAVLYAGCSRQNTTEDIPAQDTAELPAMSEPTAESALPSDCSHLLWPLTPTSAWSYQLSGPTGSETLQLEAVAIDGQAGWQMAGQAVPMSCVAGGIGSLLPGLVAHPELGRGLAGSNPHGALLPAPDQLLPLGTPVSWDFELDASGSIGINGDSTLPVERGKLVFYRSVMGTVSTTVPAGTYTTLAVQEDAFLDIAAGGQPLIVSTSSTHFYAEGVGLIRIEFGEGLISGPQLSGTLRPGWTLSLVSNTP